MKSTRVWGITPTLVTPSPCRRGHQPPQPQLRRAPHGHRPQLQQAAGPRGPVSAFLPSCCVAWSSVCSANRVSTGFTCACRYDDNYAEVCSALLCPALLSLLCSALLSSPLPCSALRCSADELLMNCRQLRQSLFSFSVLAIKGFASMHPCLLLKALESLEYQ